MITRTTKRVDFKGETVETLSVCELPSDPTLGVTRNHRRPGRYELKEEVRSQRISYSTFNFIN